MPVLPPTRGVVRELWGRALDALACDGGVGRDRISIAPGSVTFGHNGRFRVRTRDFHADSVDVLGADDGLDARV